MSDNEHDFLSEFGAEKIFGSCIPIAGNLLPHVPRNEIARYAKDPDGAYDVLPGSTRELFRKVGVTKGSLRQMAKEMIQQAMEKEYE